MKIVLIGRRADHGPGWQVLSFKPADAYRFAADGWEVAIGFLKKGVLIAV